MEQFDKEKTDTDPMLIKAQKEAMESQLAELEDQMKAYEQLRTGNYQMLETPSLQKLPLELIRARIAMGMTQKQLAERLGLKEQQIQRYEETEYASASFSRLMEIVKALELEVREEIFLPNRLVRHLTRQFISKHQIPVPYFLSYPFKNRKFVCGCAALRSPFLHGE